MPRVLLIEDDQAVRDGLRIALTYQGHAVATGEEGLAAVVADPPDVVVPDLMLPGVDGFEVCRRIRASGDLPIIMLTARDDDIDVVAGLEAGADDYVVKPARARVLEARIRAVLRRGGAGRRLSGKAVERHGALTIDRDGLVVTKHDAPVGLAPTEHEGQRLGEPGGVARQGGPRLLRRADLGRPRRDDRDLHEGLRPAGQPRLAGRGVPDADPATRAGQRRDRGDEPDRAALPVVHRAAEHRRPATDRGAHVRA